MNNKAQGGPPLNMIIIGALVLIVFIILGTLIVTRSLGINDLLLGIKPQAEAVSYTSVISECYSRCRTMENIVEFDYRSMTQEDMEKIPNFCCEGGDTNGDGVIGDEEICATLYQDCIISDYTPKVFCKGVVNIEGIAQPIAYDFTIVKDYNREGCGGSAYCTGSLCLCCDTRGEAVISLSCPFVYTNNGEDWSFEHESYGFAVVKEWEYASYETLNHLTPVNNTLQLQLREELPETSYTNNFELVRVTHPVNTSVMPDLHGKIHTIKNPVSYTSLTGNLSGYVESRTFTFPNLGSNPKLLLEVKESGLVRESGIKLVEMLGSNNLNFFYSIIGFEPLKSLFKDWREEIAEVKVSVLVDNEWVVVDSFGVGGSKWNSILISLPIIEADEYVVRLENTVEAYDYDSVLMDFSNEEVVETVNLEPVMLQDSLRFDDTNYLKLEQGDYVNISYNALDCPANKACSYVVGVKGYYHITPPNSEKKLTPNLLIKVFDFINNPERTVEYCLLE
ncbi:MAG: hypothetical protein JW791_04050 [Nanoarchaeota archaeon]|nr:hypothetical protein [Nanoarchaeota archaeon]